MPSVYTMNAFSRGQSRPSAAAWALDVKSRSRAASVIAITAGCFNRRSTEIATLNRRRTVRENSALCRKPVAGLQPGPQSIAADPEQLRRLGLVALSLCHCVRNHQVLARLEGHGRVREKGN